MLDRRDGYCARLHDPIRRPQGASLKQRQGLVASCLVFLGNIFGTFFVPVPGWSERQGVVPTAKPNLFLLRPMAGLIIPTPRWRWWGPWPQMQVIRSWSAVGCRCHPCSRRSWGKLVLRAPGVELRPGQPGHHCDDDSISFWHSSIHPSRRRRPNMMLRNNRTQPSRSARKTTSWYRPPC